MIFLQINYLMIVYLSMAQDTPPFIYCISESCIEANGIPCERSPPCVPIGDCERLPMNEPLRFTITHFHNQVRSSAATTTPGASKMRALQYCKNLETIAQCWINTCTMEKSSCLSTPLYESFGQNVGSIDLFDKEKDVLNDSASLWQEMMTVWTDESDTVNTDILEKLPTLEEHFRYEHYIQIVTDYVARLGCAWSSSNETMYFACFYGPIGAVSGQAVYEFGSHCSKCPIETECYKPLGLCAQTGTEVELWKTRLRFEEVSKASKLLIFTRLLYTVAFSNLFFVFSKSK